MRYLNETEVRNVAGGVDPAPFQPPGPRCGQKETAQDIREILMWWKQRQRDEELRKRFSD